VLFRSFTNFSGTTLTGGAYNVSGTFEFPGANIVTNAAKIILTGTTAKILNSNTSASALANLAANALSSSLTVSGGQSLTTAGAFTNSGSTIVEKGSKFTVGGAYTQTKGTPVPVTKVDSTGILSASAFLVNGGALEGNTTTTGMVMAPVTNGSIVIAGDSKTLTGTLTVQSYTQAAAGNLNVQIKASPGGGCAGAGTNYSQLAVKNGISLDGTLTINLVRHPVLNSGDCFNIMTGLTRSGQFATVKVAGGTQPFTVNYLSTGVQLVVP
jgi:hypothetical protein